MLAVKRIIRYVKETQDFGILFEKKMRESDPELIGYTDSNWSGDKDDRKSIVSYVLFFGKSHIS